MLLGDVECPVTTDCVALATVKTAETLTLVRARQRGKGAKTISEGFDDG